MANGSIGLVRGPPFTVRKRFYRPGPRPVHRKQTAKSVRFAANPPLANGSIGGKSREPILPFTWWPEGPSGRHAVAATVRKRWNRLGPRPVRRWQTVLSAANDARKRAQGEKWEAGSWLRNAWELLARPH